MKSFFTFAHTCRHLSRVLLVITCLVGGGNFAWGDTVDNGDGTLTENFVGVNKIYSSGILTLPTGWSYKGSTSTLNANKDNYLYVISQSNSDSYYISPEVEGNFSFSMQSRGTSYPSSVKAYKCTYKNEAWVIGDLIEEVTIAKANPVADFAVKTISLSGHSNIALLPNYCNIDDFTYTPYYAEGSISVPTGLAATSPTATTIDLSWTAGDAETIWQFKYGKTSGSLDHKSGYITSSPYTLTGLEPGATYYIAIRALNDVYSAWSDEVSFTTAAKIAVTGVTVSPTSWEMLAGETKTLTATVAPDNATFKTVTWESSNTDVATVSSTGVVTAENPGTTTITVKSTADETKLSTCEITVTAPVTPTAFKTKELTKDYAYLTWANGSTESKWQIKYGRGEIRTESEEISSTSKPFLITFLSPNTTYYASIRSKLGTAWSEYSDEISFTTPALGPAPKGAIEKVEDFESGWTFNGSNYMTGAKTGWADYKTVNSTNYKKNTDKKHGDSGNGLSAGYNSSEYIITPAVQGGSTISFWSCKTNTSTYVKLYKAIKVGNNYYVDDNTVYANVTPTESMSQTTSSEIIEGGYVAIHLYNAAIDDITYMAAPTESIVTDNYGNATFASGSLLDLTDENLPSGLKAYKANVDGSTVKFTKLNQCVPANTGIFLQGDAYTEYKIAVASTSTEVTDNDFLVNTSGNKFDAESGYTYFGMKKNTNPLIFGVFDPSTVAVPASKAYLKVETSSLNAARELKCVFDDGETTGIRLINENVVNGTDKLYDLQGRRVAKPTKGLYIQDGKKFMVK